MHLFSQNTPSGYTTCNAHNLQYDNVITYICTFTLAKDKWTQGYFEREGVGALIEVGVCEVRPVISADAPLFWVDELGYIRLLAILNKSSD